MFKIEKIFFICACFLYISCTQVIHRSYSYSLNIQEIDCNRDTSVLTIKNRYISYEKGLFEYQFQITNRTVIKDGLPTSSSSHDSVSVLYIPENKLLYYKYDLKGNFILKDSVKKLTKNFIKINPENNNSDQMYLQLKKVKVEDLSDTFFNGMKYKVYTQPQNIKESLDEIAVQLFFIKDVPLKTPFNINGRYPNTLKGLYFVGSSYHMLNTNSKMLFIVSNIETVTKEQKALCDSIYAKVPK